MRKMRVIACSYCKWDYGVSFQSDRFPSVAFHASCLELFMEQLKRGFQCTRDDFFIRELMPSDDSIIEGTILFQISEERIERFMEV